jgi:PST family polysaccharide transporter
MATLTGSLIRAALLRRAAPWPVRLRFDVSCARSLVHAGLPLQLNDIVGRAPAWITPTLVGAMIGPQAVGLLTWATAVGRKPLELLQHVTRVSLTHFARLQHDPAEVERVLLGYAAPALLACGLWFCVLAVAGEDLVRIIYTEQWLPGMPALLIFSAAGMLASLRWFTTSALLALGRARFTVRVTTVTAIGSVVASVLLVLRIGFLGVPVGQLLGVMIAVPWLLRGLGPAMPARLLRQAIAVFVPMALSLGAGAAAMQVSAGSATRGLIAAAVVALVFSGAAWWAGPGWLRARVREEVARPVIRFSRLVAR